MRICAKNISTLAEVPVFEACVWKTVIIGDVDRNRAWLIAKLASLLSFRSRNPAHDVQYSNLFAHSERQ